MAIEEVDIGLSKKQLIENGYVIVPFLNKYLLHELNNILEENFEDDQSFYDKMERKIWHKKVLLVQDIINKKGILSELIKSQNDLIKKIVPSDSSKLGWVDVLKLRAVRPFNNTKVPDHVPFHRETLYASSKQVENQFNFWTPITSSNEKSGLRIIPYTHKIEDKDLEIEKDENHYVSVERFSPGHAIGYPYSPKIIKNIKELSNQKEKVIFVPKNHSILFSAMLIHGNGINMTNKTRFSVDTGFIPEEHLIHNKPLFAAKNKFHYKLV